MMSAPSVSVVIPSRGHDETLERCLSAATAQTMAADRYEIIVVDDGPNKTTRSAVERVAQQASVPVRYVPNDSGAHGPAAARNLGWRAAEAPIIAFTEDDAIPDRDWLKSGAAEFERDPAIAGVSGRVVVPVPMRPKDNEREAAGLKECAFVAANAFYRKGALEEAGGFDERFGEAWRDDTDLHYTLAELGKRLECAPWAIVVHPARHERWGISLKQQRKTAYDVLLKKKHPALYRERTDTSPRWYYPAVLALPVLVYTALTGRRRLAAGVLGVWLGLTGRFAAERLRGASRTPSHVAEMIMTSALVPPLSIWARLKGALKYRLLDG